MGDFVLGCALNIFGSVCSNLGNNLMSLGHRKRAMLAQQREKHLSVTRVRVMPETKFRALTVESVDTSDAGSCDGGVEVVFEPDVEAIDPSVDIVDTYSQEPGEEKSWTWTLGTAIYVFGSLLLFASFAFAPQSVLAALEAVQFITNIFFGKCVLGEPITRRMVLGTVALVGGMAMVVSFSKQSTRNYTSGELQELYAEPSYICYLIFAAITLAAARVTFNLYGAKRDAGSERLPHHNMVYPISFCYFSAIIGTQQLLMAKCLSSLLILSLGGENQFAHWFTYFCLFCWISSAVYWVYRLDLSLKLFKGPFIIPVLQVHFTLLAIISGGLYFQEFNGQPAGYLVGFVCGCLVIFYGVYLLAPPDSEEEPSPRTAVATLEEKKDPRNSKRSTMDAEEFEFFRMGSSIILKNEEFEL